MIKQQMENKEEINEKNTFAEFVREQSERIKRLSTRLDKTRNETAK